jgi:serine/threonine-protein kinase
VIGAVVFSLSWQRQVSKAAGAASHSQLKLAGQPGNGPPPAVSVYIGSFDHVVYSLNASTGVERWGKRTGNFVESSPDVVNGTVYIGSDDHHVYALNTSTGTLLWSFTSKGAVYSSPDVVNGTVYVGSLDDYVYALNASTGVLLWRFKTGSSVESSPAVA